MIEPGSSNPYQVEVATRPEFFVGREYQSDSYTPVNSETFFRSELFQPLAGDLRSTVYILPKLAWELLRKASRLYYRVRAVNDQTTVWSTPDDSRAEAPFVDLIRGQEMYNQMGAGSTLMISPFHPVSLDCPKRIAWLSIELHRKR